MSTLSSPPRLLRLLARALAIALAASLAGARAAPSASAPAPIPLRDFFAHAERGHFRISADGATLAWLAPVVQADGRRRANVFVQALAGTRLVGRPRQLTHESARDVPDIAWKGSRTLLYQRDADGDENFHVIAVDSRSGRTTDLSPSGRVRASVLDDLPGDPRHVLVQDNRRDTSFNDVWRVDVASGAGTRVAENPGDITRWFTDHQGRVRLACRTEGLRSTLLHRADEQSPWTPIVETDFRTELEPQFFAADDRHFYALSNRGRDRKALVRVDPAQPDLETLLFEPDDVDVGEATWSRHLGKMVRVDYADDRLRHRFFDAGNEAMWRELQRRLPGYELAIQGATAAEDRFIVSASSDRTPGTRWLFDARSHALVRLAVVNPRLREAALSPMASIRYRARDGRLIHGYLTLPGGVAPGARGLACVVHPHGGPWHRDTWTYDPEVQFLASRGYCVLQMNFRGSTGYGRGFWEAGFGQWGLAMQDDVTDGAQWLVARGIADPARLAIYGASYGGYVALAGAAFTPGLYAAVVDYAGIGDLASFLALIPVYWGAELAKLHVMIGDPALDAARLSATSPALHVDRMVAPLFVAQGERDPRVRASESARVVEALRARGVAVRSLVKADEGHGFRNEENQFEFYAAMEVFLAEHLQGVAASGAASTAAASTAASAGAVASPASGGFP